MSKSRPSDDIFSLFPVLGWVLSLVVGVVAIAAVAELFGGGVLAGAAAGFICIFLPPIALPLAAYGAVVAWDWPWIFSVLFFFWPIIVAALFGVSALGIGGVLSWRDRQTKRDSQPHEGSVVAEQEPSSSPEANNHQSEPGQPQALYETEVSGTAAESRGATISYALFALFVGFILGALAVMGHPSIGVVNDPQASQSALAKSSTPSKTKEERDEVQRAACWDDAYTTYEMKDCGKADIAEADKQINAVYGTLMKAYKQTDAQNQSYSPTFQTELADKLREAERAWIKFRKKNCDSISEQAKGGTSWGLFYGACRLRMTQERKQDLQDMLEKHSG